ncbi:hypothetical protein AV530_019754 [Patagioenas fasciata monilis]|uniref:Brix domain-containing protein n=1 Tax=Patagioenas fasciata monilis TaxID=372326 RepID=A0A1V4KE03_PATFA|nr:hypothetical protein AV530_019754 [Patagioenas fasciata monilis]
MGDTGWGPQISGSIPDPPVRNHVYRRRGKEVELEEVGPRFQLRPYLIRLGTLDQGDAADVEWRWHPYTATARKQRLLASA